MNTSEILRYIKAQLGAESDIVLEQGLAILVIYYKGRKHKTVLGDIVTTDALNEVVDHINDTP